eukprot:948316_1
MNPNAHQRQMHAMMNKLNALYIKVDEMHKEIRVRDGILQGDEEIHSTIYACTTLKEYSDKQQVMKLVRVPNEQEEKQEVLWDFVCIADGMKFEHLQNLTETMIMDQPLFQSHKQTLYRMMMVMIVCRKMKRRGSQR